LGQTRPRPAPRGRVQRFLNRYEQLAQLRVLGLQNGPCALGGQHARLLVPTCFLPGSSDHYSPRPRRGHWTLITRMPSSLPSGRSSTCTVAFRGAKPSGSGTPPRRLSTVPSDTAIGSSLTLRSGPRPPPATTNCSTPASGLLPPRSRDSTTSYISLPPSLVRRAARTCTAPPRGSGGSAAARAATSSRRCATVRRLV